MNVFNKLEIKFLVGVSSALGLRQLSLMLILPLISIYGKTLIGNTPTLVGISIGIYGLFQACFQIPYGIWSDKAGRKLIILLGLAQLITGLLIASYSKNIYMFIFARALQGSGAINAVALSWIGDNIPKTIINRALGVTSTVVGISSLIAIAGSTLLNTLLCPSMIFATCALLSFLSWMYILLVLKEDNKSIKRLKEDMDETEVKSNFLELYANASLLRLYMTGFIINYLLIGVFFIVPQLFERSIGTGSLWKVFIPAAITGMIFVRKASKRADNGKYTSIQIVAFILVLAGILTLFSSNFYILSAGIIIFFNGFLGLNAIQSAGVNIIVNEKLRGTVNGISNTLQFLGSFFGGFISGLAWSMSENFAIILLIVVGLLGICISVFSFK